MIPKLLIIETTMDLLRYDSEIVLKSIEYHLEDNPSIRSGFFIWWFLRGFVNSLERFREIVEPKGFKVLAKDDRTSVVYCVDEEELNLFKLLFGNQYTRYVIKIG